MVKTHSNMSFNSPRWASLYITVMGCFNHDRRLYKEFNSNHKALFSKIPWLKKTNKFSSRSILVQVNGRLIGSELFNISTLGGAVKKGYISAQGLYSPRDLCKSKWAASVKVHAPPFMRSTSSPSSFLCSCSPRPCGPLKSSWLEAKSSESPLCWRLQINLQCLRTCKACRAARHGVCIHFASSCRGQTYRDV